jgi:two-component system phosphate regulon sensor histidine kinase PhoR
MDLNKLFFRRMAVTQLIVVILSVLAVSLLINRPDCRLSGTCVPSAPFGVLLVAIPLVVVLSWGWERWYHKKTVVMTSQLERNYSQQVSMVDFQRRRMEVVVDHLADGVLLLNARGEIRLINKAACQMFETTEKDAMGQPFSFIAWQHQLIALWQSSRESNQEVRSTLELDRRNLFLEVIISPIEQAQSGGSRYLIVLQDLTRIHRLESIRRDFISNVSHELLTPIASVRAVVETLEDGALDDRVAALRFLGRAADEVDAMTQLVNELLTLTRIESGATEFHFSAVPVSELLLRPSERFAEQAGRKKIDLIINMKPELPLVFADSEQIWQVIRNLLHNAIKHTPKKGKVRLSARKAVDGVEISISDTGVGIHSDDLPRIFERFYKADRARNRKSVSGTGLGLSIAKHIVLAHQGRIWAESKLGKGSTFTFLLPIADAKSVTQRKLV